MTEDTRSAARPRSEQPEPERAAQDLPEAPPTQTEDRCLDNAADPDCGGNDHPPRAKPMLTAGELVAHLKSRA